MDLLADLDDATARLVRAVDALDDSAYAAPSLLPGWSRGHVVAHLALNAEALTGVLAGVAAGEAVAMYPSGDARDAAIEELAGAAPGELRARLFGSTTDMADALAALSSDHLDVKVERTPGSDRTFAAGEVAALRWREVEIHHVDLDAGYRWSQWPASFAAMAVEQLAGRASATLVASDLGRTWEGGADGPTVSGTAADLAWWLSGRGTGEGLTSDGVLPGIEAW